MDVLVIADGHYFVDNQNNVYVDSVFDYKFYSRYLSVFSDVYAIVRAEKVDKVPKGAKLASGDNVHFLLVPASTGVYEHIKVWIRTHRLIEKYIKKFDHAIIRVPGVVANQVYSQYVRHKSKKIAIEVVVDPWEYFAKGTVNYMTRPIFRYVWTRNLKKMCLRADGVSYVTESYLQSKYPCQAILWNKGFTASYSSVEIPDVSIKQCREYEGQTSYKIAHVAASFTSMGKGHVPLMDAVKIVTDKGFNVSVDFIGDGPLKEKFIQYAADLGISDKVNFLGLLPSGDAVREQMGKSDLFVFPTRAEGLPRVVLEAMAEGLPVISSPTCGIPEIVQTEFLVPYSDTQLLAEKIIHLIENPSLMTKMSAENIETASRFVTSKLTEKRNAFYNQLRKL